MEKAATFFLVALFCIGINAKSCTEKINEFQGKQPLLGEYRPKCQASGMYEEKQCHGNSCFCVDPTTGVEVKGTRVSRVTPLTCPANTQSCADKMKGLEGKQQMPGEFRPKCQKNGLYQETQCRENYCFCVKASTGEELQGTRVTGSRPVNCKATKCILQRHEVLKKGPMPGAFQPQCETDGSFKKTQCHASTGYCYCVFPETGDKVLGTELRFLKPTSCEMTECVKQRHEAMKSKLMGVSTPACEADGSYKAVQSQEGFYFCVMPETGKELLGTRKLVRGEKPTSCQQTKCVMERHEYLDAERPLLGKLKPKCNEDGTYQSVQCQAGWCYCVFPTTGEKILGTTQPKQFQKPVSCKITQCVLKRNKDWAMVKKWKLLGVPISRCDPYGKYEKMQCRNSMCWCVDPNTGSTVDGTSVMTQWTMPKC